MPWRFRGFPELTLMMRNYHAHPPFTKTPPRTLSAHCACRRVRWSGGKTASIVTRVSAKPGSPERISGSLTTRSRFGIEELITHAIPYRKLVNSLLLPTTGSPTANRTQGTRAANRTHNKACAVGQARPRSAGTNAKASCSFCGQPKASSSSASHLEGFLRVTSNAIVS